jgi:hypothetical protein
MTRPSFPASSPQAESGGARTFPPWALVLALGALLYLGWAGERLIPRLSATADEPTYVAAGLSYWINGDYRISTGNFFFTQKWATLPLVSRAAVFPTKEMQERLHDDPVLIGSAFLFGGEDHPREILAPARRMTLVLCFATALLAGAWAWSLGGAWAAALAILLYATSPLVLAHGMLATTDMGVTLWFVAAFFAYDRLLRRPNFVSALACGGCLGLMLLSKFLLPAWIAGAALLLTWKLWRSWKTCSLPALLGWHAAAGLVAVATIWAFFGGQFAPGGLNPFPVPSSSRVAVVANTLAAWRLLPAPFLREFFQLAWMLEPRPSYLFGAYHEGGQLLYFPVAFLAKSTIALLFALALSWWVRRGRKTEPALAAPSLAPLAAGSIGFLLLSLGSPVNVGARHILPVFVFAIIAAGVILARLATRGRLARGAVVVVALLACAESWSAHERPLAWFNVVAGGPMNGYRIMVDSSLEWGGDLPEIAAWQEKQPADEPVFLSALAPPGHQRYGVRAESLVTAFYRGTVRPGFFIFSATRLVGGAETAYGAWTDSDQKTWEAQGAHAWRRPLPLEVAGLAVSRLAASCRARAPDERIGPVYFVYRLDDAALTAALGPGR